MADPQAGQEGESGAKLDALRKRGIDRIAPVRFAYLAALAQRAVNQPEAIRRLLSAKIAREADDLAARHSLPPAPTVGETDASTASPLAELLAYIGEHAVAPPTAGPPSTAAPPAPNRGLESPTPRTPELKSVAHFRDTWSKLCAEQQLTQTLAHAPENAGPMNSQHLVLRALKAMRDCSPDYLQGFMSYVDTLIWLEQASAAKPIDRRQDKAKKGGA